MLDLRWVYLPPVAAYLAPDVTGAGVEVEVVVVPEVALVVEVVVLGFCGSQPNTTNNPRHSTAAVRYFFIDPSFQKDVFSRRTTLHSLLA